MKTTFRSRSNPDTPLRKRLVLVLVVLLLGVGIFSFWRDTLTNIFTSLSRGESNIEQGLSNLVGFFTSKNALIKENEILKEKLQAFDSLVVYTRVLESTTEELISHFGRPPVVPSMAAGVLAHPPQTIYDVLIIDIGSAQGVEVGDKVSLPEGGALGKISEVGEKTSKVNLYSGNGEKTSAVLERKNIPVVLLGVGGGTFKFSVPRDVGVEVGDKILLPGLRAELVGVVAEVTLTPTDSEKRAIVRALGNLHSLRFVAVNSR